MVFIFTVILILTEKLNRAIVALSGALITYLVLTFLENKDFSVIMELLFGTTDDGFVNFHSLLLILGIMFIVQISDEVGTFQFVAIYAIKLSKGKPKNLMTILAVLAVFFSAIVNNILTVMILIPLTITTSRMLDLDPKPYILTQAVLVNLGGTIFSISSIPNILINTYAEITFRQYFLNVGLFSILAAAITILFDLFLYEKHLVEPEKKLVETLAGFNPWNVIQNRRLFYSTVVSFVTLMLSFLFVPPNIVPPDIIALIIAMVLTIISGFSGMDAGEIIKKFDYELLFYLLGIFVIAGGMELVGIINFLGKNFSKLGTTSPVLQILLILWFSAILSSLIDNIPITQVLIPIVGIITTGLTTNRNQYFYSLSIGANWGDNLTPLGDNILVVQLSKKHKRPISIKSFWKLGFISTLVQLFCATIYFLLILKHPLGFISLLVVLTLIVTIWVVLKFAPGKTKVKLELLLDRFRMAIIS